MSYAAICNASEWELDWKALPPFPAQGVAGPFVGVCGDDLIVAGGANFPVPPGGNLWEVSKVWRDGVYILHLAADGNFKWQSSLRLRRPVAYGATVSTLQGLVCMGGEDSQTVFKECFLLCMDGEKLIQMPLPDLPQPCSYGSAALIGSTVYLAGGQSGRGLDSALNNFWALDLSLLTSGDPAFQWKELSAWPGPERTLNLTVAQHNGTETCIYVISGRSAPPAKNGKPGSDILKDVYEFSPKTGQWRRRSDIPEAVYAGSCAADGESNIFVLSGVDHATVALPPDLRERHPGFPKRAWAYNTINDVWAEAGPTPENQIVTPAVQRGNEIFLVSGETGPRLRSQNAWRITVKSKPSLTGK